MGDSRKALADRGLPTAGTKSVLTMRLQQDLRDYGEDVDTFDFEDPDHVSGDMFLKLKALLQAQSESIETKLQVQSESIDTKLQAQIESSEGLKD